MGISFEERIVNTTEYKANFLSRKGGKRGVQLEKEEKCKCTKILVVDDDGFNIYALQMML